MRRFSWLVMGLAVQENDAQRRASQRLIEPPECVLTTTLPKTQRAERVPRVGATLARVQVSPALKGQLALESVVGAVVVAAVQVNESAQPMQTNRTES